MSQESPHISPTSSKPPPSSPKRKRSEEDLDEMIDKKVKLSLGPLTEQINDLTRKAAMQDEVIDEQKAVIKQISSEVSSLKGEITELNDHIVDQDRVIDELVTENEEQKEKIETLLTEMSELEYETEVKIDNVRAAVQEQAESLRYRNIELKQLAENFEEEMFKLL